MSIKKAIDYFDGYGSPYDDLVIKTLEKQVPRACETDDENNFYNCPCCGEDLMGCYGDNDKNPNHCLWCGQRIDWSVEE